MNERLTFRKVKRIQFSADSCARCRVEYPDQFQVCSQHGDIVGREVMFSQALGKFGARLAKVETIIEPVPGLLEKIDTALDGLKTDRTKIFAFAAGVSMAVSTIVLGVYYLGSAIGSALPWLKNFLPKGGG